LLFLKIPIENFLSCGDPFSIVTPVMINKRVLSFPSTTGIGNDQHQKGAESVPAGIMPPTGRVKVICRIPAKKGPDDFSLFRGLPYL
jgi:hypothetical protein